MSVRAPRSLAMRGEVVEIYENARTRRHNNAIEPLENLDIFWQILF